MSERKFERGIPALVFRICAIASTVVFLAACATTPPASQYLDTTTGATVFRVGKPLGLLSAETNAGLQRAEFVSLAPFWVNRMGGYRLFLWVSFVGGRFDENPVSVDTDYLEIEGGSSTIALELTTRERRQFSVGEPVYTPVAGWETAGYYEITAEDLDLITHYSTFVLRIKATGDSYVVLGEQSDVLQTFTELQALVGK